MNATAEEWVEKAEADWATARREARVTRGANYDAVCFHAQQCVEKLMKALLICRRSVPPKTHDLVHLDQVLTTAFPRWSWAVDELRLVSRAAVAYRYPGEAADRGDAAAVMHLAGRMRRRLRSLLKKCN